ncbi:MAG TPA: ABC transporter ATP-binding protein [Chitinophagaceae bacterium]|nr:ABC transporter ATP-binding protein [Chitinophagaceae bacterium]
MNKTQPFKKLTELIVTEKKDVSNIYVFATINGLIQLSLPLGVQAIIGFVLGGTFSSSLFVLISFVILGVFFAGMVQIQQMKIIERLQQKIFHYYAFAFKKNTITTDLKKSDNLYFPELMNRFLDVTTLQKSFSKVLLDIPLASIQISLGLIIVAIYHPLFLVLIFIMLLIILLLFYITSKKGLESSIKESSAKYEVASWLEEIARVVHVFKLNKNYGLQTQKMDDKISDYINYRTKHFNILLYQFKNLIFLKIVITAVMLIVGTYLLIHQQLNIGQFVAAEIIIITMIASVEKIIVNLDSYYDILTAIDKLNITEYQPKEINGNSEFIDKKYGMQLEFNNVSFQYDENTSVFSNLNFVIQSGDKVTISGEDGSGKSTLIRIISSIYTPSSGSILFNDIPMNNYKLDELRQHIGLMFNRLDVFNGSILDNITLGNPKILIQDILHFSKKIGLDKYVNTKEKGYDTEVETIGKRLPRTVVKKILFLRAIVAKLPLIILEEPFSEMEANIKHQMKEILVNDLKQSTVLVVTSDQDFIQQFDKNFILHGNTIQIVNK